MLKDMKYLIMLSLLLGSSAWADENTYKKETLINLSALSSITLAKNEVVVNYRMEAIGIHAKTLRKKVNGMSQLIHQQLKGEKGMKQTTLSRRMEIRWRYDKVNSRQVRDGWKLVQVEQIVSTNLDAVPHWVDAIEKAGAHLTTLHFRISDAAINVAQNSLRLQAIQAFRTKASSFAKALGATSFRIVQLQTSQQQPVYRINRGMPDMALMAKSANAPAPSFHTGEGKISVTVSGSIALPFKAYSVK